MHNKLWQPQESGYILVLIILVIRITSSSWFIHKPPTVLYHMRLSIIDLAFCIFISLFDTFDLINRGMICKGNATLLFEREQLLELYNWGSKESCTLTFSMKHQVIKASKAMYCTLESYNGQYSVGVSEQITWIHCSSMCLYLTHCATAITAEELYYGP